MQIYKNLDYKSFGKKKMRMNQSLLIAFILWYEGQEQMESKPTKEAEEAMERMNNPDAPK